jgi:hypothetical protein
MVDWRVRFYFGQTVTFDIMDGRNNFFMLQMAPN